MRFRIVILSVSISFLTFISCSNYKLNPVESQNNVVTKEQVQGNVWYKVGFPTGTKSVYAYTSELIFAGTQDGRLFVSKNNCNSWKEAAGVIKNRSAINSIDFYVLDNVWTERKSYVLACSDQAIYLSTDEGNTWTENYVFQKKPGYVEGNFVKFGYKYSRNTFDFVDIFVGGRFFNYNSYSGVTEYFNLYSKWIYTAYTIFTNSWDSTRMGSTEASVKCRLNYGAKYFCGFTDSNKGFIFNGSSLSSGTISDLGSGNEINSITSTTNGTIFIGTKTGLFYAPEAGSYLSGFSWRRVGLYNMEIKFLASNTFNVIFAGTSKGLFCSYDGVNWKDMCPFVNTSIECMAPSLDGYIYIKTNSEEYYYIKPDVSLLTTLFAIPLYNPPDNTIDVDLNLSLKWGSWNKEEPTYWLQVSTQSSFNGTLVYDVRFLKCLSYTLDNLKNKTKYYWRIRAETVTYKTDWSGPWSFTTR